MKIYLKKLSYLIVLLALFMNSCDTEESFQITSPDAKFILKTPGITSIFLNFALPDNSAFTISWEDEVTGASSYDIEMAVDREFTTPITLGNTSEKNFSMTVSDFNEKLKDVGITSFENTAVFFRIKAGSANSNSILMQVTTFAVQPPVITSPDATFSIVLSDIDPEALAMTTNWDDPEIGENSTETVNYDVQIATAGTDFATINSLGTVQDLLTLDINHSALNELVLAMGGTPGEVSNYDIRIKATVETGSGDLIRTSEFITIAITPYETVLPAILYVVGAGAVDAGWSWDSPVELTLQGSVYSGNIKLTPNNGGNFRFFTVRDDWSSGQNYTYYETRGYTFDNDLTNANDGDNNFLFTGVEDEYSLVIDTENETITLGPPITSVFQISTWGIVGSGYNNWGAFADAPFYTSDQPNVFVSYVTLLDGEIKFRENNEWTNNFGDNGADGTLDAGGSNIATTAGNYKVVLNLNTNTYTIEQFSWGVVGSAWNDWGNAGPDAKFFYDYTTDTFKLGVKLQAGEMKFRKNNEWTENFGDTGADGTLDAGGDNIITTAGYYAITLDLNNNTYTIDAANLFGVVGSGFNNWGADGPDFTFTEVNSGNWIAEIVTLVDGEIKFRVNEEWTINFGDTGADGTLDEGGDNIAVTAGNYRIFMNFNNNTYSINN